MEALEQFKKREQDCQLVVGKSVTNNTLVAKRENEEVFVARDYRNAFYRKPTEQTFYCEEGKGFSVPQASNLIQGRSVYRDDLVPFNGGDVYKAWIILDIEQGKTGLNFKLKTFRDPAYGFDLNNVLKDYAIKGITKPENVEELITA